jgi:hypothetical protein
MATFRFFILPAIIAVFLAACSSKTNPNEEAIRYLNKSIESSKSNINKYTEKILVELENKLMDPASAQRAITWYPKGKLIQEYSKVVIDTLEKLQERFISYSFQYKDLEEVPSIDSDIKSLEKILKSYNRSLLEIDPALTAFFSSPEELGSSDSLNARLYPVYLFSGGITINLAICLLNQFENNIRIIENRMIQFANNKVAVIVESFESYSTILGISANRAAPGTKLEITAGVGEFSKSANAKISIDGKLCPLSEDGAVHYEFNTPKTPGKYKKRVKIDFINEIGKMEVVEKDVSYSVVQ